MQDTTISNQETSLSGGDEVINVPEALQAPTRTIALPMQLLIGAANLVVHLSILPVSLLLLPTQVAASDPVHKISNYGFVATIGAFVALLANLFVTPRSLCSQVSWHHLELCLFCQLRAFDSMAFG